jgi:hypothetical protein
LVQFKPIKKPAKTTSKQLENALNLESLLNNLHDWTELGGENKKAYDQ